MALIVSTAVGGNYSVGASWVGGVVPTIGVANADVVAGSTIVIDQVGLGCGDDPGPGNNGLTIHGTLDYSLIANSSLTVRGDISGMNGGALYNNGELSITYLHELILDCVDAVGKYGLNIEDGCVFKPECPSILRSTTLSQNCAAAQAIVHVEDDVQAAGWKAGDEFGIPPTGAHGNYLKGDKRTINAFASGTQFDATVNFTYAHDYKQETYSPQTSVVLLTRNVRIRSNSTTYQSTIRNKNSNPASGNFAPKHVEFKDLGIDQLNMSIVFSNSDTATPGNTTPAFGTIEGCTMHGKFAGIYYVFYQNTSDKVLKDFAVYGTHYSQERAIYGGYQIYNLEVKNFFALSFGTYNLGFASNGNATVDVHDGVIAGGYYVGTQYLNSLKNMFIHTIGGVGYSGLSNYTELENNIVINVQYCISATGFLIKDKDSYYKSGGSYLVYEARTIDFDNCYFDPANSFVRRTNLVRVGIHKKDRIADNHQTVYPEGDIWSTKGSFASPRDIVRTAGGMGVMMEPVDASNALKLKLEVSGTSGKQVVVSGYFRKTAAYNGAVEPKVTLSGIGITSDTQIMSVGAGSWELWTLSGTPTEDGQAFVEFEVVGTAGYVYLDDIVVTGADVNTGDFDNWSDGLPAKILFATKVDAAQLALSVADQVWDELDAEHQAAGSKGKVVSDIQAKTDNLPASPAPASEYDTEMARITADVATEAKQDIIDGVVDNIWTKVLNIFKALWNKKTLEMISETEYTEKLYDDNKVDVIRTHSITKSGDTETRDPQ